MAIVNSIDGGTLVTTFTSSGTWTKSDRASMITVIGWGGGGGGGSGRRGASTAAGGGSGGGAGGAFWFTVPASFFGATEAVVIGLGGTGGIAQTVNSTDGSNGTSGGNTSFGYYSTNAGAIVGISNPNAGAGGTSTSSASATGRVFYTSGLIIPLTSGGNQQGIGPSSGQGTNTIGNTSQDVGGSLNKFLTSTSGGGGGGADSVTERYGSNGGRVFEFDDSTIILQGGVGGLESSVIDGTAGNDYLSTGGIITGGTGGGGGGGQSAGAAAGNGGKGGFPGGGGGGGGGSLNGTNSGTGGDGGDGLVIVIEYLI